MAGKRRRSSQPVRVKDELLEPSQTWGWERRSTGKELRRHVSSENGGLLAGGGGTSDGAGGIQVAAMWCPGGWRWEVLGGGARGSMGASGRWLSGARTGS
jgi:hypothetical protein